MKRAFVALALVLSPALAQARERFPVCPILPGAVICSEEQAFGQLGHRALKDPPYEREKTAALATGKCRAVTKPVKTIAVQYDHDLTDGRDLIKVRTADEPRKWQYASVYLMYQNPREHYSGKVKCGLHPQMQEYEID